MKCPDPDCGAPLRPQDRHCPRCGRALGLTPATPPPAAQAQAHVTRDSVPRTPIAQSGEAYPALRRRAQVAIVSAGVLRWVLLGLGVFLLAISTVIGYKLGELLIGALVGLVLLGASGVVGWLLWVRLAVFGEMTYLILDLADIFRRK